MPFERLRRKGRGSRDPFDHLRAERERAESGEPWFRTHDNDGPELDVQAGISSNLSEDDLIDKDDE